MDFILGLPIWENEGVLFILAVAPCFFIAILYFLKDKYEKEPPFILFPVYLLGIVLALPAILWETSPVIKEFFGIYPHQVGALHLLKKTFFMVALPEEIVKIIPVLLIYRLRYFNEPFDGIVYTVFAAMGLASIENYMYVIKEPDTQLRLSILFWRGILSIPAHALFGVFSGYAIGKAKFLHTFPHKVFIGSSRNSTLDYPISTRRFKIKSKWMTKIVTIGVGILIAAVWHSIYNFLCFYDEGSIGYLVILQIILMGWIAERLHKKSLDSSPYKGIKIHSIE